MNSCCALPIDMIAADQHNQGDMCYLVTEKDASTFSLDNKF